MYVIPASKMHKRTKPISLIVIHCTQSATAASTISWFENPSNPTCAHYVVDTNGDIHTMCSVRQVVAHCKGFNEVSVGIEMIGFASAASWPDPQVASVGYICAQILYALHLPANAYTIKMHSQISTTGHTDPGKGFDYGKFLTDTAAVLASMVRE